MSYTVSFYTFTKRSNSTKVPSSGNNDFACNIKNGSGILTPKVELNLGLTSDPSQYNYCHIAAFDRWYYVTEWYFEHGLWTATCKVDVLATYKSQIGSTSMYVLRSSAQKDGSIVDTLYPMKTGCTYQMNYSLNASETPMSPYSATGAYVIGVVSPQGDYGSITYHVLDSTALGTLCSYLINSAVQTDPNFTVADASLALQTALIDPIQYIKSCMWFPFVLTDFDLQAATTTLPIFMWTVSGCFNSTISGNRIRKQYHINVSKHPSTTARGNYVNTSPYTMLTLDASPFGIIDIDTTVTCNLSKLDLDLTVDPISGKGKLRVNHDGMTMHVLESQIGVPIQLSQVTKDWFGATTSAISAVGNIIGAGMSGNIGGMVSGVASGIESATRALIPRTQSLGSGGGFIDVYPYYHCLIHQFFTPVDDDNSHNGRPYCQVTTPSSLTGYMLIQDGDVAIPGTKAEADEIRSLLEGGFYYE